MNLLEKSEIYRKAGLALLFVALGSLFGGAFFMPHSSWPILPLAVGYIGGNICVIKGKKLAHQYRLSFGNDAEEYF